MLAALGILTSCRLPKVQLNPERIWNAILIVTAAWGASWFLVRLSVPHFANVDQLARWWMPLDPAGLIVGAVGGGVTVAVLRSVIEDRSARREPNVAS
jgi:hypothetical protein